MKGLAKIGLIIAAAATVLLIFIFEVYKPQKVSNRTMSAAPEENLQDEAQNLVDIPRAVVSQEESVDQGPEDPQPTTPEVETQPQEEVVNNTVVEEEINEPIRPATEVDTRRIYGKITLAATGENLSGVNIMIPGSSVAKISNNTGGYTIEVPVGTQELIFIYRGKKLVRRISGSNTLLNVRLDLDAMEYD